MALLLAVGLAYSILVRHLKFGIPCVFNKITGLKCPGCGVTHMCLSLLKGDFQSAWHHNPAIMALLPAGILVAADISWRYVKENTRKPHKWANALICVMIAVLLIFGIVRNLKF